MGVVYFDIDRLGGGDSCRFRIFLLFSFADVASLSQEERTQELERTNPRVCARSRRTSVGESIDIPLG